MNTEDRLVIKQLSKHGELLDCINCFPSKVTVLRAESETDLVPYRQAVSGQVSGKKFSVSYNNKNFIQSEHIVIGFGSWLPGSESVSEVLVSFGVLNEQAPALLNTFGLAGLESKVIADLTLDYLRRLELLCASYSKARVVVLDSPFEPINSLYKDKFAELILNDTLTNNRITVVTRLCYRPEQWVGNETIERIQVGSTIQKTVGFGAKSNEIKDIVSQLRKSGVLNAPVNEQPVKSESYSAPSTKKANSLLTEFGRINPTGSSNRFLTFFLQPQYLKKISIGATVMALLLLGVALIDSAKTPTRNVAVLEISNSTGNLTNQGQPLQQANSKQIVLENSNPSTVNDLKSTTASSEVLSVTSHVDKPRNNPAEAKPILDFYPPNIKKAVLDAFHGTASPKTPVTAVRSVAQKTNDSLFDELKNLKPSTKETSTFFPSYSSPPSSESQFEIDPSVKERQEEIRRRFLEALQRASDRGE